MKTLLKVNTCENSDRGSERGPCQPMLVLEQMVPRVRFAECRIVFQDPNLKIQDVAQLPVSACAQLPTMACYRPIIY